MTSTQEAIRDLCNELCSTLQSKNSNYGDTAGKPPYFAPWLEPQTALLVRMSDKVSRLKTLLTRESDKVGESLRDTALDLAGYSILLAIELDKTQPQNNTGESE